MSLPSLSHLQFAILDILEGRSRSGKFVRVKLAERGIDRNGPMFYQIMARLEDAGFVEGWYEQKKIEDTTVRERTYKITGDGVHALNDVRLFYVSSASSAVNGAR
ncbi:MAG: PadR family transcriptional regulator [Planctomycetaceae bacterium]|nr:PadR family transcriptional regulator [Planctomycetaceae bacterium]MCB9953031.1 PadR family transcriptional regulator [Planctomycetaceae bacterium]